MILGASPTLTWDRSHAWQVCERVARVATVGVSLPSPGQSPGFRHCYLHLCSPFSANLCLKYVLLQRKHIISSCVYCGYCKGTAPCLPKGQLRLWRASLSSFLRAINPSSSSFSLGSCCVDLSSLLSFSFIFLYSQEMYPPFQVYSCNKRAPLAFVFCTLYLLALIDFFIIYFISTKPDCKNRGAGEELTPIQFCWGCKLDPSIPLSRKTNKMPILWGAHVGKLCNEEICKPSFSLWVAKWLFKAI